MVLLAIDPGLEKTGYAIFDKDKKYSSGFRFIYSGIIKTSSQSSLPNRLQEIYNQLVKIIKKFIPQAIVFEKIFFFKNQKTMVNVAQSQGVILFIASQNNLDITELTPLEIKHTVTGYGLSDKKAIKKMVDLTLKLNNKRIGDDEYDAIACGLTYCFQNDKLLK